jgi:hypothetical protein
MAKNDNEIRQAFARMASQAIINRDELAALLATTAGAITQMTYRGELPPTAFPAKRRACWFVGDIREWLDGAASERQRMQTQAPNASTEARIGRPRHSVEEAKR